ncbi:MAG: 50S ribosomal protein L23 [Bacillota bacterium]|jgi:large subunit ribosomal protein L23
MRDVHDILVKPMVSEKSMILMEENKYAFIVAKDANKIEIKRAIEKIFDVSVINVTTRNQRGKLKRMGRYQGYCPDTKRAIVTLKEGDSIQIFEGM